MRLGLDVGNAKVKLALDVEGETRFATHLPPYRAERRYDRAADFEEGIDAAQRLCDEARQRVLVRVGRLELHRHLPGPLLPAQSLF